MSVGVEGTPIGIMPRTSNRPPGRHQPGRPAGGWPGGRSSVRPVFRHSASSSGLSGVGAVGEKLLTRMPYGARSIAAARTKLASPPLWNAYAMTPPTPCHAFDDRMLTMLPLMPRSIMAMAACLVLRKFPAAATVTARLNEARSSSSRPRPPRMAALLIRMSIRPQRSSTSPR